MRFISWTGRAASCVLGCASALALSLVTLPLITAPAEAQNRGRTAVNTNEAYPGASSYRRVETRRSNRRTRITVRPRSYLDAGTMVLPHSQSYLDYAVPPLSSSYRIWDTTGSFRSPLPGTFPGSGWLP